MTINTIGFSRADILQVEDAAKESGLIVCPHVSTDSLMEYSCDLIFAVWRADESGALLLDIIRRAPVPIVIFLDRYSADLRQKAFAAGAHDVLCLPADKTEIMAEIRSFQGEEPPAEAIRRSEFEQIAGRSFIGVSSAFRRCVEQLRKATLVDANILLLGETGTGKEIFARVLHRASNRSSAPFVGVNCAAIPETLLESELFGSRKGAFSGAENIPGRFESVGAGTLLLDEIGEMSLPLQAKLLRVVQEREFQPLGSSKTQPFSARLVAATWVDLHEAAAKSRFRKDLIERLDQMRISLPSLRERREDIPLLAKHFLRLRSQGRPIEISISAMRMLEEAEFPGNIRQIDNTMIKAIAAAAPGAVILPQHLPSDLFRPKTLDDRNGSRWQIDGSLTYADARARAPIEVDRFYLSRFLERHNQNKTEAAKDAGIDRKTFTERWKVTTGLDE